MKAPAILDTAKQYISTDRNETHGDAEENFTHTAALWSAYLETPISAIDVANCLILLKISRINCGKYNVDDYIDIAGYSALAGGIAGKQNSEE